MPARFSIAALALLLAVLRPPDALGQPVFLAIPNPEGGGYLGFGYSLAAYGDDILVGDVWTSKVYLFDGETGAVLRTFVSPNTDDYFGWRVAAVGTKVLVGAPTDDTSGDELGAAYLFDGATGALVLTLYDPAPTYHAHFGSAVAAAGPNLLIGAPGEAYNDLRTAYMFDGSTGALLQSYVNPSPVGFNQFGRSVAAVSSYVVVGAPDDPVDVAHGGAVYVFDAATGAHVQTLANPNPYPQSFFGQHLAPFGTDVLVGSFASLTYRFDPATAAPLATYPYPTNSVGAHAGNVLLGGFDGAYVLDPVTGTMLRRYGGPTYGFGPDAAVSIGNKVVAVSSNEHFRDRFGAVYSFCGGLTECGPCETCDASGACVAAPHPTCRAPLSGRSTLMIKDATPNGRDRVVWTVGGMFSDPQRHDPGFAFGTPTDALAEHDYTLCVYDESAPTPSVVFQATAPAAGDCGGRPCWRSVKLSQSGSISGYAYLDGEQTPHGLDKIFLKTTTVGGGIRLKVQGKGEQLSNAPLGMATPPLNLPLRVQLHNRHGYCWEDTYATASRNEPGVLRATARTP
jgi:hypothetical protein